SGGASGRPASPRRRAAGNESASRRLAWRAADVHGGAEPIQGGRRTGGAGRSRHSAARLPRQQPGRVPEQCAAHAASRTPASDAGNAGFETASLELPPIRGRSPSQNYALRTTWNLRTEGVALVGPA